jgi:hypothetical protein
LASFKLPAQQLKNFADVQLNFDKIAGWLWGAGALRVLSSVLRNLNFGTGTVTFTASATSATVNVNHGLGVTPALILTQPRAGVAFSYLQVSGEDATKFTVQGHDVDGTVRTGTNDFYWAAIA